MDWFNSAQSKLAAMVIGGAVFFTLDKMIGVPNFKPPLHLKESAPDWANALTWGLAAAVIASIFAYFKFGPKIAGPVAAALICAAIFVRLCFYG